MRKCQFRGINVPCDFCQTNPVTSKRALDVLRSVQGFMYEPTPSPDLEGHYMTFFQMLNATDRSKFAKPNEVLPSKAIGTCESCPAWQFSSVTEASRHVAVLHRVYKKTDLPSSSQKIFECKTKDCNLKFQTSHQLSKHRVAASHFVRKRKTDAAEERKERQKKKRNTIKGTITRFFSNASSETSQQPSLLTIPVDRPANSSETTDVDEVWECQYCGGTTDDDDCGIRWLACDSCDDKFHLQCSGKQYEEEEYDTIDLENEPFCCTSCKEINEQVFSA